MNVVYSLFQPTSSEILVNDVQEEFSGPGTR